MSVGVCLHLDDAQGSLLATRLFDSLPRLGETIVFRTTALQVIHEAHCTVTRVVHTVEVNIHQYIVEGMVDVPADVFVVPQEEADAATLRKLFPDLG